VISGRLTTTDANGIEETAEAGELFFWPAGHNVKVNADAEIIMFSPQKEHTHVIDHMIEMVNA
jgi:ethanolamine utilization protein EutQ (cupin superfamily)